MVFAITFQLPFSGNNRRFQPPPRSLKVKDYLRASARSLCCLYIIWLMHALGVSFASDNPSLAGCFRNHRQICAHTNTRKHATNDQSHQTLPHKYVYVWIFLSNITNAGYVHVNIPHQKKISGKLKFSLKCCSIAYVIKDVNKKGHKYIDVHSVYL